MKMLQLFCPLREVIIKQYYGRVSWMAVQIAVDIVKVHILDDDKSR